MDVTSYKKHKHVLLFFSGGLDTSFLLRWFTKELGTRIVTVSFDLGGDGSATKGLAAHAKRLGAYKHITINAKKMFIEDYCWRAVKANAKYGQAHPLSSSLSRPLMAKIGVDLARKYGCSAIMHGSNGWQNNSARFDTAIRVLSKDLDIIEPVMEQNIDRKFEFSYLERQGITIKKETDNLMSSDVNIWGREVEDGVLEYPDHAPDESIYRVTSSPERAPDKAETVVIEFSHGIPKKVDGKTLTPVQLVEYLNKIGGKHGVGRHDAMEDKIIGHKTREIHESPAATMLLLAHQDLEMLTVPRKTLVIKNILDNEWTQLACLGLWHHPLREQIEQFSDAVNERVSGKVSVKMYKGSAHVIGRTSRHGLDHANVTRGRNPVYKQSPNPNRNFFDYYAYEAKISELTK